MHDETKSKEERERERETMGLENPAKDGWPSSSSWSILAWSSSECSCFCCTDSSNCTVLLADIDIWISHRHTRTFSLSLSLWSWFPQHPTLPVSLSRYWKRGKEMIIINYLRVLLWCFQRKVESTVLFKLTCFGKLYIKVYAHPILTYHSVSGKR